jgi:hypothetical protein
MVREWAEKLHRELARAGAVTHAVQFSPANTSAPVALWRELGGFDPRFVGWGGEDYELGLRLLRSGVAIAYDPLAVAWHDQRRSAAGFLGTKRDEGRNTVRIVRLHPDAQEALIAAGGRGRGPRALRRLGAASPGRHRALARLTGAAARVEAALTAGRRHRLLDLAAEAHFLCGVVETDERGDLAARLLGR